MKKLAMTLIALSLTFGAAQAKIVKSQDRDNRCDLYKSIDTEKTLEKNEVLVTDKSTYGMSLSDMDVDFDQREVKVSLIANVVWGFNMILLDGKTRIAEDNKEFKYLVNQLNRKLNLFEKVCIGYNNELVYAKEFPVPENK